MSKTSKIALAAATAWPPVYMCLFMYFILHSMFSMTTGHSNPERDFQLFDKVAVLHVLTIFWLWGLVAIYIIHLFKTNAIPQEKKALWAVVLFLGNILAMPVYWYLYIWREPQSSTIADQVDRQQTPS
jgi:hypothetical protein